MIDARTRAEMTRRGRRIPGAGAFTRLQARVYRASGGRLWRRWLGTPILVLEVTGRRTGRTRATPLVFARAATGFVVAAANSGSDRAPQWYRNLLHDPRATVVLDGERVAVRARATNGVERDEMWSRVVAEYPPAAYYPDYTDREIPVLVLEPAQ